MKPTMHIMKKDFRMQSQSAMRPSKISPGSAGSKISTASVHIP